MRKIALFLIFMLSGLAMQLISAGVQQKLPDEKELISRIWERWEALQNYDYTKAYEFTTPAYRSVFPENLHIKKYSKDLKWHLTEIKSINYDHIANKVKVIIAVDVESNDSKFKGIVEFEEFEEIWLYIDNLWWYNEGV